MDARGRVVHERKVRALSARAAATMGGIANTTWSAFEKGGPITDGIRAAVAQAFGWSMDWPENLPDAVSLRSDEAEELRSDIRDLRAAIHNAPRVRATALESIELLELGYHRLEAELAVVRGRLDALEGRSFGAGA